MRIHWIAAFAALVAIGGCDSQNQPATDSKAAMSEVNVFGSIPLVWNDPVLIMGGADLKWYHFTFSDTPDLEDINVYNICFPIDVIYEGWHPWQLMAGIKPGLFSDLEQIDGDDFRLLGYGLGVYPLNPQISFARVDLPAPLRPTMLTISPLPMEKLMSCRVLCPLV